MHGHSVSWAHTHTPWHYKPDDVRSLTVFCACYSPHCPHPDWQLHWGPRRHWRLNQTAQSLNLKSHHCPLHKTIKNTNQTSPWSHMTCVSFTTDTDHSFGFFYFSPSCFWLSSHLQSLLRLPSASSSANDDGVHASLRQHLSRSLTSRRLLLRR